MHGEKNEEVSAEDSSLDVICRVYYQFKTGHVQFDSMKSSHSNLREKQNSPPLQLNLWRQRAEDGLGIRQRGLDDAEEALEARVGSVADGLVHPALAGSHGDAGFGAEAVECDGDLGGVGAADGVGDDVDAVSRVAEVEGGLGDADVALDAHEGDGRGGGELGRDGGDVHRELGLVVGRRGEEGGQLSDGRAELGDRLGGGVDGDGEVVGEDEELLGCEDAVCGKRAERLVSFYLILPCLPGS